MKIHDYHTGKFVFCVLTGSKEARIFWEVWEDSQSSDQQQHIICWFTGEAIVHSRIRR